MSEWNHSPRNHHDDELVTTTAQQPAMVAAPGLQSQGQSVDLPRVRQGMWIPVIAGTLAIVMTAGILWQIFQPHDLQATTGTGSAPVSTSGAAAPGEDALANVNGQYISYNMVASECFGRIGQEVLDSIINRTLIQQEVQKRGIVVSEAEVQQEVAKIAKEFNLGVDMWYQMLTTERGISPDQYRKDIIWPKLALEKIAGTDVKISDQDMQKAFVRDFGPRVRCRLIMLDNLRRANEVWQKASTSPDDFERLAREFSIDSNSRALGGSIPPIRRYSGNEELENAAFKLKAGEISSLIQIDVNRFVILKCEGATEPVVTDIKDVWNDLYAQQQKEKVQERVITVFEDIKKSSRVDNFLTNTSTGGVVNPLSQTTPGQMPAGQIPAGQTATGIQQTSGTLR